MAERNITVYIEDLDISDQGKNTLMRMKIRTLNEFERINRWKISAVPRISEESIRELLLVLDHIDEIFSRFEKRVDRINEIHDDIKEYTVDRIPFSNRAINALKRADIFMVGDLIRMSQKDISNLHNVGILTRNEIITAINEIIEDGRAYFSNLVQSNSSAEEFKNNDGFENRRRQIGMVIELVGDKSIDKISFSTRAFNSLKSAGINTVKELLQMSESDISGLRSVGTLTQNEITAVIAEILDKGIDYSWVDDTEEAGAAVVQVRKGFDFEIIDRLVEEFWFKPIHMTEWFGLSRQGIYNVLEKRSPKRHERWIGKVMTDQEYSVLVSLVRKKTFEYKDDRVICCCMNNRQDDLACIFVYEEEIKCFFLKDLTDELQRLVIANNFHKYTERELDGESEGKIIYVIRKPFFLPSYPDKFRANALFREMTTDEYSMFISGYPLGDQRNVTDEQITSFFDENLVDGKVYLSSDPKNQWIRSLASRNGYSLKEFIEFYGYESKMSGIGLSIDWTREKHIEELKRYIVYDNVVYFPTDSSIYRNLMTYSHNKGISLNEYLKSLGFERTTERPVVETDILEKDMEVRTCEGRFEDKVFAGYPLVGSCIIKQETLDKLNEYSRRYIDTVLRDPSTKLTLRAEMQISLALINNAKNWRSEENSDFWKYIALQFGYRDRDANGTVVRLLKNSLERAMKKNHRLFIEDANGRAFKSTAVIHALTTRKSWMALFDFLFDFYKNNLNWRMITGDPLIEVMIRSLRQKLAGDGSEDTELTISYRIYSFQEGIRKLVLFRPMFARGLFEKLLAKIDAMVNSEDLPAKTYEEQLCEEWFKEKITSIANSKRAERQSQGGQRDVAIDYSRIRAKYILEKETDVQIILPDIRLKCEDIHRAQAFVYIGGVIVHQQNVSWYGNELGKTLNGFSVSLPELPYGLKTLDIQVRITCDDEEIFNSDETLYRRGLIFYGNNEYSAGQIKKDNYTFVIPESSNIETENTDVTEVDDFKNPGLKAFFLELKDGYAITIGGRLIAIDYESGTDIRVITPAESNSLPCVTLDDQEYYFAYQGSVCSIILGKTDFLQQFVLMRDGEKIEFSSCATSENGLAFSFPLVGDKSTCRLQVINLADERLVFDRSFMLVKKANCEFNREFYYSVADYKDAKYRVDIDEFTETISFNADDDEVRIPFRNGNLHVKIPKIVVEETSGEWMNGASPAWYISDIPQTSMLRISNPPKTNVYFYVGGEDIKYDGEGLLTLGNVLQSFCDTESLSFADVQMKVSGSRQSSTYTLTRVCYKEGFLRQPEFWTDDAKLFWNCGGTFVGKSDRIFTLYLYGETDIPFEFRLDENTEFVKIPDDMPIGNYRYEISILSGSLFKKVKEVIAEGDCIIGDQNSLRFRNRRIVVDSITDESNEEAGHIPIKTCYIDHIEFVGMKDTSEGYCPVYSGVMYRTGYHGERHEYSFDKHTDERGVTKMMVNPVRIVYIGDAILCITDPDGDGLYYYNYYDKYLESKVYALTDHEYTKQNKHKYANADLYLYRTERI